MQIEPGDTHAGNPEGDHQSQNASPNRFGASPERFLRADFSRAEILRRINASSVDLLGRAVGNKPMDSGERRITNNAGTTKSSSVIKPKTNQSGASRGSG